MEKIWQLKKKVSDDPIEQLLFNRGIVKKIGSTEDLKKFLEPDFDKDFFDPWLLPDFEVAINRIKSAIGGQEKIGIYADYDADGIPGAALLYRALQTLENQAEIYIPARVDGYGFNKSGIDYLISKGCKLIISVDLGIRELEFAKYIAERNVDLIISDHHEPDDELPKTLAVINPKRKDSKYPFRELCGAGVVFKIIQGLGKFYPKKINEKFLKWNLDLPAISTISDVVPLISENRIIAKFGLKVLSKTKNIGLQELYKVANIDQNKIDSYTVGFQIGPRINAPGRLDHATESFVLLTTKDPERAYKSAKHLQEKNEVRQIEMEKIFQSAIKIIDSQKLAVGKIIIVKKSGWQKGIIGPVASRIVEKYLRPVIILSEKNGILDGSCRSISGFDITKALQSSEKYLLGFGGHSGAAGVHLEEKDFEKFKEKISEYANEKISEDQLLPKIPIDLELGKRKISVNLFKEFEKFEPFGLGNPKPIFLTSNIKLISHRLVGKENKHLQLRFSDGISETKAVVFNHGIDLKKLISGENYNIVYQPGLNFWNGKNWIDLRLLDIKNSEGASPQI
ncbi:single-stranded-DNA-specific exonuclease RecJ [Candidatus Berkelbacteria bacterium CG08_land_8_20_14_0_20_39_8]|uniref:Single-stranded-DNA-specific exonuclease RecJ n=1 Tax=Candidatus Berkelbacteria bacterium CG08_land_8_20_14_0_20_39_8 TaxID=1974511 RepID=A0A2M6YCJ9_9BACT|nr:MAG: single-stranded-DNA-specific exonuclease RecJ [Candidatus Berkelbacteria bacterium CG08_land_8_20_14_0_20_39_8]